MVYFISAPLETRFAVYVLLPSGDCSPEMQHKTQIRSLQKGASAAALLQSQAWLDWSLFQTGYRIVYGVWVENKYKVDLSHVSLLVHHFCNVESGSGLQKLDRKKDLDFPFERSVVQKYIVQKYYDYVHSQQPLTSAAAYGELLRLSEDSTVCWEWTDFMGHLHRIKFFHIHGKLIWITTFLSTKCRQSYKIISSSASGWVSFRKSTVLDNSTKKRLMQNTYFQWSFISF